MKTIDYVTKESWLSNGRPHFVGASDSPSLFGEGYAQQNEYSLYAEKAEGIQQSAETTEAMEVGKAMEPVIRSLFQDRTAIEVVETPPYQVVYSGHAGYIGCTLDGEVISHGERGVWEAKNVGEYVAADWAAEEPPLRVQVQVQHQLLCTGYSFGYAVALLGGNRLVWRRVERNEKFIEALKVRLMFFWDAVQHRNPPPIDGSAATREALKRLYPHDDGVHIALPIEATEWDEKLREAKVAKQSVNVLILQAENQIKAAMGTASIGVLPGGGRYTCREQERKAHSVKASKFRVLRRCEK